MSDELDIPEIPPLPDLPELPDFSFDATPNRIRPASELQEMTKDVWGPIKWRELHTWAESIPCAECRGFAEMFATANHDLVNLKLGKPVHDKANLVAYLTEVDALIKKAGL